MRWKSSRAKDAKPTGPRKLLVWAALASLLFGLINAGELFEDHLRILRNKLHTHDASGEIVFVGIDDKSLQEVGEWPWPRSTQAQMVERAGQGGASHIFLDLIYEATTKPADDLALATAIERSARSGTSVTLAARERLGTPEGVRATGRPIPLLTRHAEMASISVPYNYQMAAWRVPFSGWIGDVEVPSFAAAMAKRPLSKGGHPLFRLDYSMDPNSIPYVSASDLLKGRANPLTLRGKTVVIGVNTDEVGDRAWFPGYGRMGATRIQILGAETLKSGIPRDLGFLPAWVLTFLVIVASLLRLRGGRLGAALGAAGVLLLLVPVGLESHLYFADVTPALFLLLIVGMRLSYVRWRSGGLVNSLTGLPNLEALRRFEKAEKSVLVAARVQNFPEIASTLAAEAESELVRQIVGRLSAGGGVTVYQGDEGIFAWYADQTQAIGNHLEALHAMFRSPFTVDGRSVDVALTFGVDLGSSRRTANRMGSALMAANEAWAEGLRWKYHDPARREEVSWRLSLLGQLDAAIDNGEVWIAYQPQFSLKTGQIIGAEALARWTHPEKGPISPTEFVAAAEQQGRIGKLTDFVLDRSVATAAAINRRGVDFTVAVNMSARLLSDRQLLDRVKTVLKAHGLPPERLTLELTETEALHNADGDIAMLDALRQLGVRIAIDDYGTGLSTLEYLKKVPANEIKIDQSFVKAMRVNRSDLLMVQSTIALAHSLGRTVVAEGVEDQQCLHELTAMQCDVAQGYAIGRPMGVRELVQCLQSKQSRRVA